MKKQNVLVLLSGGMDSSACIEFYLRQKFKVEGLFINYGQISAKKELTASKKIAKHYKILLNKVESKNLSRFSSGEIIGRNAFLLTTALLNFKKKNGIICIGIHDGTSYPDCSKKFIKDMQEIFDIYKNGAIQIGVPFLDFKKIEIGAYCKNHKVPINYTYSCELGNKQPCGKCLSCKDLEIIYDSKK
jgi:7-cyano-7-deazaguanine synthase